ncbi:MAG: zinc ABC transporter substrate-binding protein, partial [Nitrososphaera sp.]|nr:zinc ABC transporter substrate-binding protein [Nitrososphaera sp.]
SAGGNSAVAPADSNTTSKSKLKVVTSVAPITNIVRNIGGDRIELTGIVPEGVNSHTFELIPSDAITVRNADLVIINGLHLETDFEKVVEASGRQDLQLLGLADNTITRDEWVFDFSFPEEEGDPNPHLWLNVSHAMKYAQLVHDKLVEMDPDNASYYSANADRYLALLQKLDDGIMQSVKTVPEGNRKLVTYHDSWAYFAPRYGMTVIGAVQPSDFGEPTPQEVARIIDQIRTAKVPAIFASEVFPSRVVDQIAREANVQIVETLRDDDMPGEPGSAENTYVGMMLSNMQAMIPSLGGNVNALKGTDPSNTYGVS